MSITIGIIGGLGPEGTIHYYRKLIKNFEGSADRPGIVVEHVWMDRFATLMRTDAVDEIEDLFLKALDRLHRAGSDIALVAAVTPDLPDFFGPLIPGKRSPVSWLKCTAF